MDQAPEQNGGRDAAGAVTSAKSESVEPQGGMPRLFEGRQPVPAATGCFLLFLVVASLVTRGQGMDSDEIAGRAAWVVLTGLLVLGLIEVRSVGWQGLVRVDLAALGSAFFLTLAEFLWPQPHFANLLTPQYARQAVDLVLLGLGAVAVGRHGLGWILGRGRGAVASVKRDGFDARRLLVEPRNGELLVLFLACFALGQAHLFLSIGFDLGQWWREVFDPRFSQSWSRERYGGWGALLSELQLLNYLLPPLAVLLLRARRSLPQGMAPLVMVALAFVMLNAFAGGSRHIFLIQMALLLSTVALSAPTFDLARGATLFVAGGAIVLATTMAVVEFRNEGLRGYLDARSGTWTATEMESSVGVGQGRGPSLQVDQNLFPIGRLVEVVPDRQPFLGEEMLAAAVFRAVPRALWPGKPKALSFGLEEAVGAEHMTVAAAFVGEAYLMGGVPGVVGVGLALGLLAAAWNRMLPRCGSRSWLLLYVSGFHWALLAMRSPLWLSVALLPTLALWVTFRWALPCWRQGGGWRRGASREQALGSAVSGIRIDVEGINRERRRGRRSRRRRRRRRQGEGQGRRVR